MNKQVAQLLEQHFDAAFAALNGVKKLRELILTLAMQGRLVPQDPKDTPASELLKEIEAEKRRLVREGKIKQPKALPPVTEEEMPYVLPLGWEWVRLRDVCHDWGQKVPSSRLTYIDVGAIDNEVGSVIGAQIILASDAPSRARKIVRPGTVIYSTVRPYLLNVAIVEHEYEPEPIASTAFAILHPYDGVLNKFVFRYLRSPIFIDYVESTQKGVAYPAINDGDFFSGLFPFPPTEEQHRIVAKIDELMARCDELEKLRAVQQEKRLTVHGAVIKRLLNIAEPDQHQQAQAFLAEHFWELYTVKENVAELRKAILQLAVMGKLVPQNPNDSLASELLKEIEAERQRLVKAKKIKKPKPVPSMPQDDEPFSIPDNWQWVRIVELTKSIDYGTSQKTCDDSSLVPVYRMGNITDGQLIDEGFKYIAPEIDELPRLFLQPNDILFNRTNSYELVGKSARYTGPVEHATFASYLIRVRLFDALLNPVFISLAMNAPYFRSTQIEPEIIQQCGQANFNGTKLSLCAIPLPPLSEQHRIVARIEQLMALCNSLDQQIEAAAGKQIELLNALICAQSQGKTEQESRPASLSKAEIIDLTSYRAAMGCYAVDKLANARYFGRTAAAKLMYLAQAHVGLALNLRPERQAAGPLDTWIYEFEQQGQSQGWFEVHEKPLASGKKKTEYRCLPALAEPVATAKAQMSVEQHAELDRLIYALADKTTQEVEIIATLFAVWNDFLIDGQQPTDAQIITDLRENWHESKRQFEPVQLAPWLDWLRKEKFVPQGRPPRTAQQAKLQFH